MGEQFAEGERPASVLKIGLFELSLKFIITERPKTDIS